jgi:molecular chaperone Hsp33
MEELLSGFAFDITQETPVRFHCPCTTDKVIKAVLAAGPAEVEKIIQDRKDLEVFCDYCRKRYIIPPESLRITAKT